MRNASWQIANITTKVLHCKIFKVFCMHECLSFKIDDELSRLTSTLKGKFAKLILCLVLVQIYITKIVCPSVCPSHPVSPEPLDLWWWNFACVIYSSNRRFLRKKISKNRKKKILNFFNFFLKFFWNFFLNFLHARKIFGFRFFFCRKFFSRGSP